MKIYIYNRCSTCQKALKNLNQKGISYQSLPIRETPPTKQELEHMLGLYGGNIKKLINVSGMDYRNLGLKDKIKTMTQDEILTLLTENGNLVKRPFLVSESQNLVGFKEEVWDTAFES